MNKAERKIAITLQRIIVIVCQVIKLKFTDIYKTTKEPRACAQTDSTLTEISWRKYTIYFIRTRKLGLPSIPVMRAVGLNCFARINEIIFPATTGIRTQSASK